jgi:lipopolysaccharide export LptBFGC system permease protein LptF
MGKGWIVGAVLLLAWVVISMYFIVSGAPVNLPPAVQAYLPHFVIVLAAGLVFFRFRKLTGDAALDQANLLAVASGIFLLVLAGFALVTWGNDSAQGRNWFLAAVAWSPVAIFLVIRYRNLLKAR